MNPPPLPQPAAQTCPNCGAAAPAGARLCSNCGAALYVAKKDGCLVVLAQVVLGLLAITFGLGGACYAIFGNFESPSPSAWPIIGGVLALVAAGGCIWGIARLGGGRR